MSAWTTILDRVQGKAPAGAKRSSRWPSLRRAYLAVHTECLACGRRKKLEAHHVVPFHIAPDLELDQANIIALCRRCHLFVGHLGAWARVNPFADADARYWRERFTAARS